MALCGRCRCSPALTPPRALTGRLCPRGGKQPTVSQAATGERCPPGLSHGCPVGPGASSGEAGSGEAEARAITATGREHRPVQPNALHLPQPAPSSPNPGPRRRLPARHAFSRRDVSGLSPQTSDWPADISSPAAHWPARRGACVAGGYSRQAPPRFSSARPRGGAASSPPVPSPSLLSFGPCQAAATNVERESLLPPGVGRARAGPAGRSR